MDQVETPIPRAFLTDNIALLDKLDGIASGAHVSDVPPAFYRDYDEPPPPPDDPHWREWPHNNDGREPVSRLWLIGVPLAVGVLGVLHVMAIMVALSMSGL